MIGLSSATKIYLFAESVDMRKGFDELSDIVKRQGLDIFSGHLFVFISKRGDRMKILTWERGGFALWYKRLEKGTFKRAHGTGMIKIDSGILAIILEELDPDQMSRPKRWSPQVS